MTDRAELVRRLRDHADAMFEQGCALPAVSPTYKKRIADLRRAADMLERDGEFEERFPCDRCGGECDDDFKFVCMRCLKGHATGSDDPKHLQSRSKELDERNGERVNDPRKAPCPDCQGKE